MRWGKMEVSGGFLLIAAILLYLDTENVVLLAMLAAALHEAGHWVVIRLLGGRVGLLRITAVGAELRLSPVCVLSWAGELAAALAGPGINIITAVAAVALFGTRAYLFGGLSIMLALFNLLPILPLDGGRALLVFFTLLVGEEKAQSACRDLSLVLAGLLLLASLILLLRHSGNFTLLLVAGWLFAAQRRKAPRKVKKRLHFRRPYDNIHESQ